MNNNPLFNNIEKKTGVKMNDLMKLVNSVQNANFNDEKTVRNLIKEVSAVAKKPVSKQLEDQIVKTLMENSNSIDFGTIAKMLDNKK